MVCGDVLCLRRLVRVWGVVVWQWFGSCLDWLLYCRFGLLWGVVWFDRVGWD